MRKLLYLVILLMFSISCWYFLLRPTKESELIQEGNYLIGKIEVYKQLHLTLPNSLEDIGIVITDESMPEVYYQKIDSIHYVVFFGTSLGESKTYYSDSKKWEGVQRKIR